MKIIFENEKLNVNKLKGFIKHNLPLNWTYFKRHDVKILMTNTG